MSETHRHTLLVVDDEPRICDSVHDLLRQKYRVLKAHSAKEGMEIMEQEDVHIVMTDQRMPQMTGVELIRRLRLSHPWAVRMLFTGFMDFEALVEAINDGRIMRFLRKPWTVEELGAVLDSHAFDERDDLRRQPRLRWAPPLRSASPEAAEQVVMPAQQCLRPDQHQRLAPVGEQRRQTDQDEPIGRAQFWALDLADRNENLVAQEGVLYEELFARARQVQNQAADWALFYRGYQGTSHDGAHYHGSGTYQAPELRNEPPEHAAMEPLRLYRW
jgi:YesN/AraC family two-component response regulator